MAAAVEDMGDMDDNPSDIATDFGFDLHDNTLFANSAMILALQDYMFDEPRENLHYRLACGECAYRMDKWLVAARSFEEAVELLEFWAEDKASYNTIVKRRSP
eukprot:gene1561-1938_t